MTPSHLPPAPSLKQQQLRRRKRRSADFEIMNDPTLLVSPDAVPSPEVVASVMSDNESSSSSASAPCTSASDMMTQRAQAMPGSRRSKRLKRKSIEMCRRSTPLLPVPSASTSAASASTVAVDCDVMSTPTSAMPASTSSGQDSSIEISELQPSADSVSTETAAVSQVGSLSLPARPKPCQQLCNLRIALKNNFF